MRLTFLGTGTSQGVPMIGCGCEVCLSSDKRDKRLRTSAMVEVDGARIVIDAGPDFRYQMLRAGVKNIDGVIITHEHKDHIGGLDDVRAFNYWQSGAVSVFCQDRVATVLRKDFDYAFDVGNKRYPGVPDIEIHRIEPLMEFKVNGVSILPIAVRHFKLGIVGFKIGGLCYITDANSIGAKELDIISGCDVLVLNALRCQQHISHFTLSEALDIVEIVKPKRAFLTHISHQLGRYVDVMGGLPKNVELAYDGLEINC